jgi:hypothetical protein
MAEAKNYLFTYKEIAEALVKAQDIHEGLWAVYVEFGLAAGNIPAGPTDNTVVPAAVVPILKMGIQRAEQPNALTVDAAEVNPLDRSPATAGRGKRRVGLRRADKGLDRE